MRTFTTTIEDHNGTLHTVSVYYEWKMPRAATHDQPPEGGVVVLDVECKTKKLTLKEERKVVEECYAAVWEDYRNGGM